MVDIAARVTELTGRRVQDVTPLGTSHAWRLYRLALTDGTRLFAKAVAEPDGRFDGVFRAEALGLQWLDASGEAPVARVLGWDATTLVLPWVEERPASPEAAVRFGRRLARMHSTPAPHYGAGWEGFIGPLPLDNTPTEEWPKFYAERRLAPYLRRATDRGALTPSDARLVERVIDSIDELAGDPEPPARIHGDLWSGNVLWHADGATLIDPAAHGGHRETDLAMLALFGLPYLEWVRDAYNEAAPLAAGWRGRVPLHQLHPLLVHVCLFGAAYRVTTLDAARAALRG